MYIKRISIYLIISSAFIFFLAGFSQGASDSFWYPSGNSSYYSSISGSISREPGYVSTPSLLPFTNFYTDIYSSYYGKIIFRTYSSLYSNPSFYAPPPYNEPLWQALKQSSIFSTDWNSSLSSPSDFRAYYPRYAYSYKDSIEIHLTWKDNSDNEDGFIINYFCGYNGTDPCGHITLLPNTTELTLPVEQAIRRPRWIPHPTIISFSLVAYNAEGETAPVRAGATMTIY